MRENLARTQLGHKSRGPGVGIDQGGTVGLYAKVGARLYAHGRHDPEAAPPGRKTFVSLPYCYGV